MHPKTAAALKVGHERWAQRMRELKAAGIITRFPGGKRPKGSPPLSKDKTIRRAQKMVEKLMAEQTGVQTTTNEPPRSWGDLTKAEKLSHTADLALDCTRQILELGIDPSDAKTLAIVKDTALNIISQQIRLDALKDLHARGDATAANGRAEEQRLFDLAFADLSLQRPKAIEAVAAVNGDDGEDGS